MNNTSTRAIIKNGTIYIAAPFFNDKQLNLVKSIEKALNTFNIKFFSPRLEGKTIKDLPETERQSAAYEAFQSNLVGLYSCSSILVVLDEKDTGTAFECGFWTAMYGIKNKLRPIITFQSTGKPLNIMLQQVTLAHLCDLDRLENFFTNVTYNNFNIDDYTPSTLNLT